MLTDLEILEEDDIPESVGDQDHIFAEKGCFVGMYTLEVDMMKDCTSADHDVLKAIYKELISGGEGMYNKFVGLLDDGDYWTALSRIESNISKGRFAQRLSRNLTMSMVPGYVKSGLKFIIKKVKQEYE